MVAFVRVGGYEDDQWTPEYQDQEYVLELIPIEYRIRQNESSLEHLEQEIRPWTTRTEPPIGSTLIERHDVYRPHSNKYEYAHHCKYHNHDVNPIPAHHGREEVMMGGPTVVGLSEEL